MTRPAFNHAFTASHVADIVLAVHDGRVVFHDGDDQLAAGLSVHLIGGHTDGLQSVRLGPEGADGPAIVLASDATHYYENIDSGRPFPIVFDVGAMVEGYDRLRHLAGQGGVIVPGHDPLVFERHSPADKALSGIAIEVLVSQS